MRTSRDVPSFLLAATLVLSWLLIVPPMLYLAGCQTSARTVAYNTLDAVAHTVDTALVAFNDARVAGKVDDATYTKATEVKGQYEKAFLIAFTAAHANLQAPAPQDLANIAAALVELLKGRTK